MIAHLHLGLPGPSALPQRLRDWAHPCHVCSGTGLTAATSAPGLGSPLPHPRRRRDWAHPSHICTGTGLTPPTSAPGRVPCGATCRPARGPPRAVGTPSTPHVVGGRRQPQGPCKRHKRHHMPLPPTAQQGVTSVRTRTTTWAAAASERNPARCAVPRGPVPYPPGLLESYAKRADAVIVATSFRSCRTCSCIRPMHERVCARACACVRVRALTRVCVRAFARVCVCACACVRVCARVCAHARVCAKPGIHSSGVAGGIVSSVAQPSLHGGVGAGWVRRRAWK